MKKMMLCFAFLPFACNADYFVGGGYSYYNAELSSGAFSEDINRSSVSLRTGAVLDNNHRLYLDLATGIESDDIKLNTYTANYEYLVPINDDFNWFAGGHIGLTTIDDIAYDENYNEFLYGVQTGIDYQPTQNITTTLAYRYGASEIDAYERLDLNTSGFQLSLDYTFN
ncbi:outer membrane protein [Vibrio coralliirubri]|uniref:outer membrane protein n=1 Tax=Vibrio coralliirubri TaxID=1516159 RepID=UPI000EFA8481|nr:outer membrane beta-barrel protein [Vibrio coralliirubri]